MWMIIAFILYALGALGFAGYAIDDLDPVDAAGWTFFVAAAILWPFVSLWIIGGTVIGWIRR